MKTKPYPHFYKNGGTTHYADPYRVQYVEAFDKEMRCQNCRDCVGVVCYRYESQYECVDGRLFHHKTNYLCDDCGSQYLAACANVRDNEDYPRTSKDYPPWNIPK